MSTIRGDVVDAWGTVTSVDIHPDGDVVLAGYHSGHVRQFDLLSGLLEWEKQPHNASITSIKYDNEGLRILTGSDDMDVRCKVRRSTCLSYYLLLVHLDRPQFDIRNCKVNLL